MRQVFLITDSEQAVSFENQDALPISEKLLTEWEAFFKPVEDKIIFNISAGEALGLLRGFYSRYELSQPQRRVRARFEKILAETPSGQAVRFVAAEVSERRSRRHLTQNQKKTEQLY